MVVPEHCRSSFCMRRKADRERGTGEGPFQATTPDVFISYPGSETPVRNEGPQIHMACFPSNFNIARAVYPGLYIVTETDH